MHVAIEDGKHDDRQRCEDHVELKIPVEERHLPRIIAVAAQILSAAKQMRSSTYYPKKNMLQITMVDL